MTTSGARLTFKADFPVKWETPETAKDPKNPQPIRWLDANLQEVARAAKKLTLTFYLWPTMGEDIKINLSIDALSGGIGSTVDLQQGISQTNIVVLREVEELIWPGAPESEENPNGIPKGRPTATNDAERSAHDNLVDTAWRHHNTRNMQALQRMGEVGRKIEAAACWQHLIIEPPDGWENLSTKDMPPAKRDAVLSGYMAAKNAKEEASGK
tara:strand:- start:14560 stop:15195 length:636 start_codon:yes stop_codon:yes gene_type:complete